MTNYVVRILSFYPHQIDVARSILTCSTLSKLVFPALLHASPDSSIHLASADQFDFTLVPKEFYADDQSLVNIPLDGENGIAFSSTIYLRESIVPNVVNLKFSSELLQAGTITIADLKALFADVIPAFQAYHASIYDRQSNRRPGGPKYFRTPSFRSYPIELGWITYFGPEMIEFLGRERFAELHTCVEKYDLHGGIMVILQEEPFCEDNPQHRERQAQAESELRLSELVSSRRRTSS